MKRSGRNNRRDARREAPRGLRLHDLPASGRQRKRTCRSVRLRAESGKVELCLSREIEEEIRNTLSRQDVVRKFRTITPKRVDEFLKRIETFAVLVDPVPNAFDLKRDPKDSKYINLAVAANAKLIVSRDNDLLDLMFGTDDEATRFRSTFPEIAILDPVAFLKTIEAAAGNGA